MADLLFIPASLLILIFFLRKSYRKKEESSQIILRDLGISSVKYFYSTRRRAKSRITKALPLHKKQALEIETEIKGTYKNQSLDIYYVLLKSRIFHNFFDILFLFIFSPAIGDSMLERDLDAFYFEARLPRSFKGTTLIISKGYSCAMLDEKKLKSFDKTINGSPANEELFDIYVTDQTANQVLTDFNALVALYETSKREGVKSFCLSVKGDTLSALICFEHSAEELQTKALIQTRKELMLCEIFKKHIPRIYALFDAMPLSHDSKP